MGETVFGFLFKYPPAAFAQGRLTLASGWPVWVLLAAVAAAALAVGFYLHRRKPGVPLPYRALVWGLQSAALAILLLLLWQPALVVSTLVPRQNVLALLVDDSASMALNDAGGQTRLQEVQSVLAESGPLLPQLRDKFQVRMYRFSREAQRVASAEELRASGPTSHLQDALAQVYYDLRHLPVAGMVLVSDGAENGLETSGEAAAEWKARKIPVFSLGVGQEESAQDVQIDDVVMPRTALPDAVISTAVTVRQRGYIGRSARLEIRDGNEILKTRDLQFGRSAVETVQMAFLSRNKGLREFTVSIQPLPGEHIQENNRQARLVEIQDRVAKVLYIEGEPRWEFKFIRRALDGYPHIRVVSLLRTSANKFYRQGVENEQELGEGFPDRKQFFQYEGLILGSINSSFFSPEQQEDIYAFSSRRGGGALFLGGRFALGDGGYQGSALADLIPVELEKSGAEPSFRRKPAKFELTARGWDRLQLSDDEKVNRKNWEKLPALGNFQVTGEPKPGTVVLAEAVAEDGNRHPLLATQRFGRGRTFLFATDGSWRWRMQLESANHSHETFWRQILLALVSDTPAPVTISSEKARYLDEQRVRLQARVYDEDFQPVNGATVVATIHAPDGKAQQLPMQVASEQDGMFRAEWDAVSPGVYRVEVSARLGDKDLGAGSSYFQRADGGLEFFSSEQNVPLLTRLAEESGGRYYPLQEAAALPEQLTYSQAGVRVPQTRDLWDMPLWILLLLLLKGTEWVFRKKWRSI